MLALILLLCQPPMDAWRIERARPDMIGEAVVKPAATLIWKWLRNRRKPMPEVMRFGGATEEVLSKSTAILRKNGIQVVGDAGEIKKFGARLTYSINRAAQEVTIIVEKKALLLSMEATKSRVRKSFEDAGLKQIS